MREICHHFSNEITLNSSIAWRRPDIKARWRFYSAVQKKVIPRVVLSSLCLLLLSAACVILLSLSLTPSAPLTFKSHSSSRSLTPLYNRVWLGGGCVCVVGGWSVPCRSGPTESNCRCCAAKVIQGAVRSRWGKIEQTSPVKSVSTQSGCQTALFTCYTIIIRPWGTLRNNTFILRRDGGGPRERHDGRTQRRERERRPSLVM